MPVPPAELLGWMPVGPGQLLNTWMLYSISTRQEIPAMQLPLGRGDSYSSWPFPESGWLESTSPLHCPQTGWSLLLHSRFHTSHFSNHFQSLLLPFPDCQAVWREKRLKHQWWWGGQRKWTGLHSPTGKDYRKGTVKDSVNDLLLPVESDGERFVLQTCWMCQVTFEKSGLNSLHSCQGSIPCMLPIHRGEKGSNRYIWKPVTLSGPPVCLWPLSPVLSNSQLEMLWMGGYSVHSGYPGWAETSGVFSN